MLRWLGAGPAAFERCRPSPPTAEQDVPRCPETRRFVFWADALPARPRRARAVARVPGRGRCQAHCKLRSGGGRREPSSDLAVMGCCSGPCAGAASRLAPWLLPPTLSKRKTLSSVLSCCCRHRGALCERHKVRIDAVSPPPAAPSGTANGSDKGALLPPAEDRVPSG